MSKTTASLVLGGVAIGIALFAIFTPVFHAAPKAGNTTQSFWDAKLGFKVNGIVVLDASRNATFANVNVPTVANATSTLKVGGIQTYATSSATSICLYFDPRGATSSFNGTAYWKYGTAPCQ